MSHDDYVTNMCMNEERGNLISWQIYRQMLRASKGVFVISCFFSELNSVAMTYFGKQQATQILHFIIRPSMAIKQLAANQAL